MSKNILVTGTVPFSVVTLLQSQGYQVDVRELKELMDEVALIEALKDKDAHVYGGYETMNAKAISSANKLKVIAFVGAGYQDFVDVQEANKKNIKVTNTPGANSQSVAEMTIGLILSLQRNIPYLCEHVKQGEWLTSVAGRELHHKNLGIIGMGNIGKKLAKIAYHGFGMNINYYSRKQKKDVESELGAKYMSLEQLMSASDIISVHVPYDSQMTINGPLINAGLINCMKPDSILINTSRADVVDGLALYNALNQDKLRAAAFDGYYTEPHAPTVENDTHKLASLPYNKFIITPHNAWNTPEANDKMFIMAAQSVIDILSGNECQYIVNK